MSRPPELAVHVVRPERGVDVAFECPVGEVVAVLGPSGAGKTTVLRALAGLDGPHGGTVSLDGDVWDEPGRQVLPSARRHVGLVLAEPLLLPHLDAVTNVAIAVDAGTGGPQAVAEAEVWLEALGLEELMGTRPGELSTGQAQRVALARALATRPDVLLLDEPLANLDVATRSSVRRALDAALQTFRGPVVMVSHDPVDAYALADRVVVVEDGTVSQEGDLRTVTARPRTDWVAQLVGLNLYRGRVLGGLFTTEGADQSLAVSTEVVGRAIATVRPQAVSLHRGRPSGSPRNVWHGGVTAVDGRGGRVRVSVTGALPVVAEITPGAAADLDLARGGGVWVSIKATEIDVYPA